MKTAIETKQMDVQLFGDHVEYTSNPNPRMDIFHVKLCPVIGFGYWKDIYKLPGLTGEAHNIVLPLIRIQLGFLQSTKP